MPKGKRQLHPYIDIDVGDRFNRLYPECISKYCERAVRAALQNRALFDTIFFNCDESPELFTKFYIESYQRQRLPNQGLS